MIQANELRIGNWIILDTGFTLPHPHKILAQDISDYSNGRITITSLQPILITTKILEKLGLKDVWIKNSWMIIEDVSGGEIFGWGMKVRNASYTKEIEFAYFKYLHQLQNLYFALTGEELNYTP